MLGAASMVGLRGRLQKEGEVIHVNSDRVIDYGDLLRKVGDMDFPHRPGPDDGATHAGSPDRGEAGWKPEPRNLYFPPFAGGADPEEVDKIKARDFH